MTDKEEKMTDKEEKEYWEKAKAFLATKPMSDDEYNKPVNNIYFVNKDVLSPISRKPMKLFAGCEVKWEELLRLNNILPKGYDEKIKDYIFVPVDEQPWIKHSREEKENAE